MKKFIQIVTYVLNMQKTLKNENQKCLSVWWVCSSKENNQGSVPKAHLVARGFEEDSIITFEKESPTALKDTLRKLLSTIIRNNLNLKPIDIKTAFLQVENLMHHVYLKPLPEAHDNNNQIRKLTHWCFFNVV